MYNQNVVHEIIPPEFESVMRDISLNTDIHRTFIGSDLAPELTVTCLQYIHNFVVAGFYSSIKGYFIHIWVVPRVKKLAVTNLNKKRREISNCCIHWRDIQVKLPMCK